MQKTVTLKSQVRTDRGSKVARKIRAAGQVPAIIYGHGKDPAAIALDLHDFAEALHHGTRIFETAVDGVNETLLVKDLQYDFLGRKVIHADLVRVDLTETVRVVVAMETRGKPKTGIVDTLLSKLEVECVVTAIPDRISLSVREMNIGDNLKAGQIPMPEGVTLVTDPEALVLMCHEVAEMKTTEQIELEMPAGPEVITERVREEEGEGGEAAPKAKEKEKE
jgi:large subunit ribosomal protein L25